MTLFVKIPKRLYEISASYIIFLISFAVGRIIRAVYEKQKNLTNTNVR